MGEVYRGLQLSLKRPVAVKRIAEHLLGDAEAIGRFAREAQCVARIQSPHVVAVYDFLRVRDDAGAEHALLVMELVDGGASLRALLSERAQAFDWRAATTLVLHAAEGLAAAAEHGVVHRDIKPDNLMVTRKGVAKLADFGLAKSVDSSAMTLEGTVMGTPLYLPPEACRGHPVDARGDLYSLGCTWFHLLAGRPPFQAASTVALLRAHLDDAPPDLRLLAPTVPAAIAALVHRLLAKDPQQRLPSAQALVDELHALAGQGLALPRTVPEVFGAESATTITRVADTQPSVAVGAPASATATLPLAPTAATVLAPPTDQLATAVPAPIAAIPPVAVPSAPAAAVASRQRRPITLMAGIAVLVVAAVAIGGASLLGGDGGARRGVEQALAANDHGLALQRATTNLAAHPGDAEAVALVRESVQAEARSLIAAGRVDDARKRLADHRTAHTWLDTAPLEREVAIAQAMWLATHFREKEAVAQFAKLRDEGADGPTIDRAMVASLADGNRPAEAIGAAWRLAKASSGPLEPKVQQILTYALEFEGPFGDSVAGLRTLLRERHPAIVDHVRPWLDGDDYEKRFNAFFLLQDAGVLPDPEVIRFHLHSVVTLSSSYTASADAVAWLAAEAAKPGWTERKAAAKPAPITEVLALKSWNEHADHVIALLAAAFLPEIEHQAVAWTTNEDEHLRWNAMRLLIAGDRVGRIDVAAYHAATLKTFNPLYDSPPFNAALAFFAAKAGDAGAKAALAAGAAHIRAEIATYEQAQGNGMALRAKTCRQRLEQVEAVLATF
jgi:serine/threonine-protein kinase